MLFIIENNKQFSKKMKTSFHISLNVILSLIGA